MSHMHCSLHLALAAVMQVGTLGLAANAALPAPVPKRERRRCSSPRATAVQQASAAETPNAISVAAEALTESTPAVTMAPVFGDESACADQDSASLLALVKLQQLELPVQLYC